MFGSAGGLIEYRAALLASRGFTVLALAFFNYDDLPKYMAAVTLDYFVVSFGQICFNELQLSSTMCLGIFKNYG